MSVIRVHKNKNFTVMSNTHLRDKNLSLKAKGLLSVMLSLPDDWDYSIAGLCTICKENETAVKSALTELKTSMYVIVERQEPTKENGGRIRYEYEVYEEPQTEKKQNEEKQEGKKQGIEILGVECQGVENHGQLNTNIPSTKKNKADTSSNDNVKADTAFPKKSLNAPKQKKTRSELIELEKDMYMRFGLIGREYDVSETAFKNIIRAFSRYLIRHRQKTGKAHPILKDETLEKIFVTLASVQDFKYNHFDNIADYEPEDGELSYLEQMVDEHFNSDHKKGTDWHISHFAVPEYLEKIAQHVTGY